MSKIIWRICKKKHQQTAFDGVGASITGGRWNSKGTKLVYTSECLALAAVELFVHIEPEDMETLFVCIKAEIPDDVSVKIKTIEEVRQLSPDGFTYPAPSILAAIGDRWIAEKRTAILVVPSAVIPQEKNYLLNPEHPDFDKIIINQPESFEFDSRMWKQ